MSKAILVLKEMPKMCLNCPCFEYEYDNKGICKDNINDERAYELDMNSKPRWCRLKPLPQKLKSASEYGSDDEYIKRLINWKKEIDEILGEEE